MADIYTSTGNMNDVFMAEFVTEILQSLNEAVIIAPLVRNFDASGCGSNVFNVPVLGTISASSVGETADLTSTAITDSSNNLTYGEIGVMSLITDKVREASKTNPGMLVQMIGEEMKYGLANKVDQDLAALFYALGNGTAVGTSGTTLSVNTFLEAMYTLEKNKVRGPKVAIFHPKSVHDLRSSIAASSAVAVGWNDGGVFGIRGVQADGSVGPLFGVPVYQTSNANDTANGATGDHVGAMIAASSNECPLGIAIWRQPRVVPQRDESRRATELVASMAYGVGELRDRSGVAILGKA